MRALAILVVLAACDAGARRDEPVPEIAHEMVAEVPLALALIVNTHELAAGNRDYEPDENAAYEGIFPALRRALLEHPPALPAGARTIVIGHDETSARILWHELTPAVFDSQHGRGRMGSDLPAAVQLALDELSRIDATRLVLFVVGNTQSVDRADSAVFPALREYAEQLGVETTIQLWQLDCFGAAAWDRTDHWFSGLFQTIDIGGGEDTFTTMLGEALR